MSARDDFEPGPPVTETRFGACRRLSREQKARGLALGHPHLYYRVRKIRPAKGGRALPALRDAADYIARGGLVEVEDEAGRRYAGAGLAGALAEAWGTELDQAYPREPPAWMHTLLYPGQVPPGVLLAAARAWAGEHFPGRPWLLAYHADGGWPHVHVLCRARSMDTGSLLYPVDSERQALREDFAARLLDAGIPVNAVRRETCGREPAGEARGALFRQSCQGGDITLSARAWDDKAAKERARRYYDRQRRVRSRVLESAGRYIAELEADGDPRKRELARGLRAYCDALPPVRTVEEKFAERYAEERRRLAGDEERRLGLSVGRDREASRTF